MYISLVHRLQVTGDMRHFSSEDAVWRKGCMIFRRNGVINVFFNKRHPVQIFFKEDIRRIAHNLFKRGVQYPSCRRGQA